MQTKKDIDELIASRLSERMNQEDSNLLDEWCNQSEENKKEFEYLSRFWKEQSGTGKIINSEELEQSIWERVQKGPDQPFKKNHAVWKNFMYLAAACLGILLISYLLLKSGSTEVQELPAVARTITKNAQRGQKIQLRLPDQTLVILNSNSQIEYPEKFSADNRTIRLVGEAYFDVIRDESRPFTVISNSIRTKVLGTTFNVRAYPDENNIKVGVIEGKVQVYNDLQAKVTFNHTLTPNQMSVINLEEKLVIKEGFDPREFVAWKEWVLEFKDQSLGYILNELEKWYDVDISIANGVDLTKSYSGSFENETLKAVLEALSYSGKFHFERSGKKVTVTK
ncbi:MAG: DUF4974 domain-containing protein [Cyclobacteriaceae bacterium]